MRFFGSESTLGRRVVLSLGFAAVLSAASIAAAQTPPPAGGAPPAGSPQTPPPPAPAADPFKFTTDAAAIIWFVKPDQTQPFEDVWKVMKGRMLASDKPDLKAMGESLRIYKMPAAAGADVQYLFMADPASKLSYNPSPFLLYESGLFPERKEADELFAKLSATIKNISPMGISIVK